MTINNEIYMYSNNSIENIFKKKREQTKTLIAFFTFET